MAKDDVFIGGKNYLLDTSTGKWFEAESGNFVRSKKVLQQISSITGEPINTPKQRKVKKIGARAAQQNAFRKAAKYTFSKDIEFINKQGHSLDWAKNYTTRGGKQPVINAKRLDYQTFKPTNNTITLSNGTQIAIFKPGKVQKTKGKWGPMFNKGVANKAKVFTHKEWMWHLGAAVRQLAVQAANFRVFVGERAKKIFEDSFRYQKFHSKDSAKWTPLSAATLNKRRKRGTGNKILREYGDLRQSMKIDNGENFGKTRVYTEIVQANTGKKKHHSICYAGYHNEGEGTYGKNGKPYIKRQFMGHSTYLDPFVDYKIRAGLRKFMFDLVFMANY